MPKERAKKSIGRRGTPTLSACSAPYCACDSGRCHTLAAHRCLWDFSQVRLLPACRRRRSVGVPLQPPRCRQPPPPERPRPCALPLVDSPSSRGAGSGGGAVLVQAGPSAGGGRRMLLRMGAGRRGAGRGARRRWAAARVLRVGGALRRVAGELPNSSHARGGVRVERAAARAAVAATASRPAAERRAERPAGGSEAAWWPSLARPRRRSHVGGCMGRFWGPVPASINFFERQ